jgi:hypothetical protein
MLKKNIEELPFATDDECFERRKLLIDNGIINEGVFETTREILIKNGTIDPNLVFKYNKDNNYIPKEEGEFNLVHIENDEQYELRKHNYFCMLSDVLKVRKKLGLILEKK